MQAHLLLALILSSIQSSLAEAPSILKAEFIFETNPVPSCHASTIAQTTDRTLVSAWFAGTAEKHPDVGIWASRLVDGRWTKPQEVATGVQPDGKRLPCWNPVLFQPREGGLMLFYKVGPSPSTWWGMLRRSEDAGKTWSEPTRLPERIAGPIKNKPIQLPDGTLLCGSSAEDYKSGPVWQIHFERSPDLGKTWESIAVPLGKDAPPAIQPSILSLEDGRLQAVGRTKVGRVFSSMSGDGGKSWSAPTLLDLPNPNSGTDAVTLQDGRHVLIYNHTTKGRSPLNLAMSKDGQKWEQVLALENEPNQEFSYPAIIQTADGLIHATYTWKRKLIKHVVLKL